MGCVVLMDISRGQTDSRRSCAGAGIISDDEVVTDDVGKRWVV